MQASLRLPEKSLPEWGIALLLFVSSMLYLLPFRAFTTLIGDEGIILQGAQRILQGQVLYRDFFFFLTPGCFYFMAMLFKIFGSSILVGRTVLLIYGGAFSALTYLLARRVCSRGVSIFVAYLELVVCLPSKFLVIHNWDSTLWALLVLYCSVWLLQSTHWIWGLGTGCFVALTCLFEQSKGAGLMFGLLLGFLIIALRHHRGPLLRRAQWAALLAGLAGPVLLTWAYFYAQGSWRAMLSDWFWPLQNYSSANKLPYGYNSIFAQVSEGTSGRASWSILELLIASPAFLVAALPILGVGFAIFQNLQKPGASSPKPAAGYYVLVSAASSGLILSLLATGRPDLTHILYMAPPLFVMLAWLVEGPDVSSPFLASVRPLVGVCLLISFTLLGLGFLSQPLDAHARLSTRRGSLRALAPDRALQYVQEHVPAGAKILVYPYQPLYYFLTATFSPTRYDYLQPGFHTRSQFQEALGELARDKTPVVLYDLSFTTDWVPAVWSSTPPAALAADPLADYIFEHYRPCTILASPLHRFLFMVRKELECPGGT